MSLTQKAKEGLEWGVFEVKRRLAAGQTPELALKETGIETFEETVYFLDFLRETKENYLLTRLTSLN